MGVVEYGDADRLSPDEARQLLAALHTLSRDNPGFRAWSEYRVAGLVQKALLPEVISVLTGPGVEFGLKMMVLQALKGSELVPDLVPILVRMVRDRSQAFAVRSEASERLAALDAEIDWCAMIDELVVEGTQDSVRLASEVMEEVGFPTHTSSASRSRCCPRASARSGSTMVCSETCPTTASRAFWTACRPPPWPCRSASPRRASPPSATSPTV